MPQKVQASAPDGKWQKTGFKSDANGIVPEIRSGVCKPAGLKIWIRQLNKLQIRSLACAGGSDCHAHDI